MTYGLMNMFIYKTVFIFNFRRLTRLVASILKNASLFARCRSPTVSWANSWYCQRSCTSIFTGTSLYTFIVKPCLSFGFEHLHLHTGWLLARACLVWNWSWSHYPRRKKTGTPWLLDFARRNARLLLYWWSYPMVSVNYRAMSQSAWTALCRSQETVLLVRVESYYG